MPDNPRPVAEFRAYALLTQAALEMVIPIVLGVVLDTWVLGTLPWLTIGGAVLGLVIGMTRLVAFANREDQKRDPPNPP